MTSVPFPAFPTLINCRRTSRRELIFLLPLTQHQALLSSTLSSVMAELDVSTVEINDAIFCGKHFMEVVRYILEYNRGRTTSDR